MNAEITSQQITWRELLESETNPFPPAAEVYAIHDGSGVIVYVGQAHDPRSRLLAHIGGGSFAWLPYLSAAGEYINANMPAALDWRITVFEVSSVHEPALIRRFNPYFNSHYKPTQQAVLPSPPPAKPSGESSSLYLSV